MNQLPKTPTEIARETVRQLTTRKLPPTPDNYQRIYHEIAGTRVIHPFPTEQMLGLARSLPTGTPAQRRMQVQVEKAVSQCNWNAVEKALVDYASLPPPPARPGGVPGAGAPIPNGADPWDDVCEQIARLVDYFMPALGDADQRLKELAEQAVSCARQRPCPPEQLKTALSAFAYRLSFVAEEDGAVKNTLLGLLHLVFEVIDDLWLKGQMDTLKEATSPPLTLRRLEEVQGRLRDVIYKQAEAKVRTVAAQEEMKRVLASFIDRLATMTESNTSFGAKIERCARRLEEATTLTDIAPVLQEAISATRSMALDTQRAGEELRLMREKAE